MSLILEALKKLEREKKVPERGFLITAAAAWPARGNVFLLAAYLGAAALLVAGGALGAWWALRGTPLQLAQGPAGLQAGQPARAPEPAAQLGVPATSDRTAPGSRLPAAPAALSRAAAPASLAPIPETTAASPPQMQSEVSPIPSKALSTPSRATPAAEQADATDASPEPSPTPAPPRDEVRLSAISRRDGKPIAVVNDRLVHEGDSFENVRVIRIGDDEVEVEVDGKRRVVGF